MPKPTKPVLAVLSPCHWAYFPNFQHSHKNIFITFTYNPGIIQEKSP